MPIDIIISEIVYKFRIQGSQPNNHALMFINTHKRLLGWEPWIDNEPDKLIDIGLYIGHLFL